MNVVGSAGTADLSIQLRLNEDRDTHQPGTNAASRVRSLSWTLTSRLKPYLIFWRQDANSAGVGMLKLSEKRNESRKTNHNGSQLSSYTL